jgi:hypothetical protein
VTTLRFHRDLYAGECVDEAMKAFAPHADVKGRTDGDYWVVDIAAERPMLERRVALELANYALGLTVRRGGIG